MKIQLTIAIPTYKREEYLIEAIDSALNQENHSIRYEILIVNNDPESDMKKLEEKYAMGDSIVRFINNEKNLGMIGNVNKCVELAKGEYVSFLHDDDILLPNYVSKIGGIIEGGKYNCLIPKRYLFFDGSGNKRLEERKHKKEIIKKFFLNSKVNAENLIKLSIEDNVYAWMNCYCAPSCGVIFKKETLRERGLFFPEGTLAWDFISFLEFNKNEDIYIVNEPLSAYRIAVGLTQKAQTQFDFYKAFDDFLIYCQDNNICTTFIKNYYEEIKYLNFSMLSADGASLVEKKYQDIVKTTKNKWKYYWFMYKRLRYLYKHGLDVEIMLDKRGKSIIKGMGIIGD